MVGGKFIQLEVVGGFIIYRVILRKQIEIGRLKILINDDVEDKYMRGYFYEKK